MILFNNPLYSVIALVAAAGLIVAGVAWRDASIYESGRKSGYEQAGIEYVQKVNKAEADFEARAKVLSAAVEAAREEDQRKLNEAEDALQDLELTLGKSGKGGTAWTKETAIQLRR